MKKRLFLLTAVTFIITCSLFDINLKTTNEFRIGNNSVLQEDIPPVFYPPTKLIEVGKHY